MGYIPAFGSCGVCQSCVRDNPCASRDEFCTVGVSELGTDVGYDETFDGTCDFTSARDIDLDFEAWNHNSQLIIYANGVSIYDSGCIIGHPLVTVTVPGGTTSLRFLVVVNCAGGAGGSWDLFVQCA